LHSAAPGNLEFVPDPAGSGRTVLLARARDTDEKQLGSIRTEIIPQKEYQKEGIRFYAISFNFPADWEFKANPIVVGQLHTSQKATVVSPPVSFVAQGRNLDLELHFNHRSIAGSDAVTKQNSARQVIRLDRIRTGQWYCFVVRADWSWTPGGGALLIWMNGDRVYEAWNSYNSYDTWLGNYPKVGLYAPGVLGVSERKLYVDFIHVGGPKTSAEELMALTPCGARGQVSEKK